MRMSSKMKYGSAFLSGLAGVLLSGNALAADRLGEGQAKYLGSFIEFLILAATSLMFLVSLVVILIAGWFLIRDYVMKDDREKRFSFAQLVVAMVVAGILGFPAGAYLLGQDLLTGNAGNPDVEAELFQRAPQG